MFWLKWIFRLLILAVVIGFFHYLLPQRDIVRITETEVQPNVSLSWQNRWAYGQVDAGNVEVQGRALRLIYTTGANGKIRVYRNEDTGFGWPPYFKFNSTNLQAQAVDLQSTAEAPKWVAVRHYGWRNELISIYPNATSMKLVASPDVRLIPWFNIIFGVIMALMFLGLFRLWQRFRRRRIDPILDDIEESTSGFGDRIRQWFKALGGS